MTRLSAFNWSAALAAVAVLIVLLQLSLLPTTSAVSIKIKEKYKNDPDTNKKLKGAIAHVVYAATMTCVGRKVIFTLKHLACDYAIASCTGLIPDFMGILAEIGIDFIKCIGLEIPLIGFGDLGSMLEVDPPFSDPAWGNKILPFRFIRAAGELLAPPVDFVPQIVAIPWLAPVLRFIWNIDVDPEDKNVDKKLQAARLKSAEEQRKEAEKELNKAPDSKKVSTIDPKKPEEKSAYRAAFETIVSTLQSTWTALGIPAVTVEDVMIYLVNGWNLAEDTVCEWVWALALDGAWVTMEPAFAGMKVLVDKTAIAITKIAADKKGENTGKFMTFVKDHAAAAKAEEAAKNKKGNENHPWWAAYVERQISAGIATRIKETDPKKPQAKLEKELAATLVKDLIEFTAWPRRWNLWWMENPEDPSDKDITRAIETGVSHCGYMFKLWDMRALMCEVDEVMKSHREDELISAAILAEEKDSSIAEMDKNLDFFSAVSKKVVATGVLESGMGYDPATSTKIVMVQETPPLPDEKAFTAYLEKHRIRLNEFMDKAEIDNSLKRHLIIKGYFFIQCAQIQAMHVMYDENNPKQMKVVTPKTLLEKLIKWKNHAGVVRHIQNTVCNRPFMKYVWQDDKPTDTSKGQPKDTAKKEPAKDKKERPVVSITWERVMKSKSSMTRYLGLVLKGEPTKTDPADKNIECVKLSATDTTCTH